ncbi:hypothetical protein ADICYQ_5311 [Cyclobacterium qasimii M12-11B]|uniref:Uncharacterized protein n=1 Tax=Cyclobacterium qasimii M12-11B TaxID=641524 RepID=S7V6Y3_9BACT|nr:hypothetical protein ADICYQ_5311 [Cyclobacterium qasimii M12-11B]
MLRFLNPDYQIGLLGLFKPDLIFLQGNWCRHPIEGKSPI